MIDEERITMTDVELSAFARKLDLWTASLLPRERAFFQQMLADAADAASEDISGYANLSSLVPGDDVTGYAVVAPDGPVMSAVLGYADGVSRAEAELPAGIFAPRLPPEN